MSPADTSGSKTTGTRWVPTRLAPRRRSVRRAASLPIDSGESRRAKRRLTEYQWSRCIEPFSAAIGATESPYVAPAYSPRKPWLFAKRIREEEEPKSAPSEFVSLASDERAAASVSRA